jgi:lipopolysaccharide biosynthesis regulator YciM
MSNRDIVNGAIAIGAVILGALLAKAIFDRNAHGYRCPRCNLTIRKYTNPCPRCHTELNWKGVS